MYIKIGFNSMLKGFHRSMFILVFILYELIDLKLLRSSQSLVFLVSDMHIHTRKYKNRISKKKGKRKEVWDKKDNKQHTTLLVYWLLLIARTNQFDWVISMGYGIQSIYILADQINGINQHVQWFFIAGVLVHRLL